MKRALVLFVLVGACTRIDPSMPARYLCTNDGAADQCPGGWRCGLEGFCIDPATPAPYRCTDTAAHCTGGWRCGLAGVCIDPATPAPHPCSDSALHCTGGWHCGPAGVCYDRADAGAVSCRASVPEDCADGWRCGLEGECHALDAGAPYLCLVDEQCEARWRCGPDGTCVDATTDGLRDVPSSSGAAGERISPLMPLAKADHVSFSTGSRATGCNRTVEQATATASYGNRLVKWAGFGTTLLLDCPDGGAPPRSLISESRNFTIAEPPVALADFGARTLVLLGDGGLLEAAYTAGSPVAVSPFNPPFAATGLRSSVGDWTRPEVVPGIVFNRSFAALVEPTKFKPTPALDAGFDGGVPSIRDVELVIFQQSREMMLVAVTDQGLYATAVDALGSGTPLAPLTLVYSDCSQRVTEYERVFSFGDGKTLAASVVTRKPGNPDTRTVQFFRVGSTPGTCSGLLPISQPGAPRYLVPLDNCGSSESPIDSIHALTLGDGGWSALMHTTRPNGDSEFVACAAPGISGYREGPMHASVTMSLDNPNAAGVIDPWGSMWTLTREEPLRFEPLTLSRVPEDVSGLISDVAAYSADVPVDEVDGPLAVEARVFQRSKGGVTALRTSFVMHGSVSGKPEWLLFDFPQQSGAARVGVAKGPPSAIELGVALSDQTLEPPFHASVGSTPDGGRTLMVASGDLLSSANVSGIGDGVFINNPTLLETLPKIRFATTPLPRSTISGIASLPAGTQPNSSYALGYLIASGRVFRFKADNPVVFRTDEVFIEPSEAIGVWADVDRARVGFSSGTVYALPSRARLAPALPVAESVVGYQGVCGHSFAVTDQHLWRLEVTPGLAEGAWKQVPLQSDDAGVSLAGARLHSDDRGLLVFRDHGLVDVLQGLSCP